MSNMDEFANMTLHEEDVDIGDLVGYLEGKNCYLIDMEETVSDTQMTLSPDGACGQSQQGVDSIAPNPGLIYDNSTEKAPQLPTSASTHGSKTDVTSFNIQQMTQNFSDYGHQNLVSKVCFNKSFQQLTQAPMAIQKKLKKYQQTTPCTDKQEETRRLNAIKARGYRVKKIQERNQLEKEKSLLQDELQKMQQQITLLTQKMNQDNNLLSQKINRQNQEINHKNQEINRLRQENDRLSQENTRLSQDINHLKKFEQAVLLNLERQENNRLKKLLS